MGYGIIVQQGIRPPHLHYEFFRLTHGHGDFGRCKVEIDHAKPVARHCVDVGQDLLRING